MKKMCICDDCKNAYHNLDGMTIYCLKHECYLFTNGYCDDWSKRETAILQEEFETFIAATREFLKPIMDKLEIWARRLNEWIGGNR